MHDTPIPQDTSISRIFGALLIALLISIPAGSQVPTNAGSAEPADTSTPDAGDASPSDDQFVDEIYVTSRKREENVQTIPISVTAFDETALEERSMLTLIDVAEAAVNLEFGRGIFGDQYADATVQIRGIGQIDTSLFADPGVGIYVDGVYLARSQGTIMDLVELERVEVLRGPQGTLFGKNTIGGAISLITKKPSTDFGGRLGLTVGDFGRLDARGSIGGRLGENLAASLAVLSTHSDGFSRSLATGQRFHDENRASGRLALRWTPSSSVTVDLTGDYARQRESGGNQILTGLTHTPVLDFHNQVLEAAGRVPYDERWISDNLSEGFATAPSFFDGDVYGTALTISRTWPSLLFQSITAYRGFQYTSAGDGDGSPVDIANRDQLFQHDQFSHEVQLTGQTAGDRLAWQVGGLYFRERPRSHVIERVLNELFPALESLPGPIIAPPGVPSFLCNPGPPPPGLPCFGGAGNPFNFAFFVGDGTFIDSNLETVSWAAFSELTYEVTDTLSLTAGLRYSIDEKQFTYSNLKTGSGVLVEAANEDDWDAWTPRLSLAWQVRPETLIYASVSRGFKSGGFNGSPVLGVLAPFEPESVWSYEAGFKSDLFNHHLRLNASFFSSDYQDMQLSAVFFVEGQQVVQLLNAGQAEIQGFELEATLRPVAGLELTLGVGHIGAELHDIDPRLPERMDSLPKTPEWSTTASLHYTFALGDRGSLIARVDYNDRTGFFNDANNSAGVYEDGYDLVGARLLYTPPAGRWDLAIFGTNLADEEYLSNGISVEFFGPSYAISGRPRELGATFQVRF